jgi:hypothetical protein
LLPFGGDFLKLASILVQVITLLGKVITKSAA